jgi:micrococcal nuclease
MQSSALSTIAIVALLVASNLLLSFFGRPQPQGDFWQVVEVRSPELIQMQKEGQTQTVRLIGVRAPSQDQVPFGGEARAKLEQILTKGDQVQVETDLEERNAADQLQAYVWKEKEMINKILIDEGYTLANVNPPNIKYKSLLDNAQSRARILEYGIWNTSRPLRRPPRSEQRTP